MVYCNKYLYINFFYIQINEFDLATISELLKECLVPIFIGMSSRFAKGIEYVRHFIQTKVGPEHIYVYMDPPSTIHVGNYMFIGAKIVDGSLLYEVYKEKIILNKDGR